MIPNDLFKSIKGLYTFAHCVKRRLNENPVISIRGKEIEIIYNEGSNYGIVIDGKTSNFQKTANAYYIFKNNIGDISSSEIDNAKKLKEDEYLNNKVYILCNLINNIYKDTNKNPNKLRYWYNDDKSVILKFLKTDNKNPKYHLVDYIKNENLYSNPSDKENTDYIALFLWNKMNDVAELILQHPETYDNPPSKNSQPKDLISKPETKEGEKNMPIQNMKFISDLQEYFLKNKLYFDIQTIRRYFTSLMTKPYIILTGISGTGKTKLAQSFAEFITNGNKNQFEFISVRPDWFDNKGLLGYHNIITDLYCATPFLKLIIRAYEDWKYNKEKSKPYFIILDEMNLAKVEYYFSDFLSCLETRKLNENNEIVQQEIVLHNSNEFLFTNSISSNIDFENKYYFMSINNKEHYKIPSKIIIPPNIYFTGTVNIDETTYMFSPKVLDRANVMVFEDVNIDKYLNILYDDDNSDNPLKEDNNTGSTGYKSNASSEKSNDNNTGSTGYKSNVSSEKSNDNNNSSTGYKSNASSEKSNDNIKLSTNYNSSKNTSTQKAIIQKSKTNDSLLNDLISYLTHSGKFLVFKSQLSNIDSETKNLLIKIHNILKYKRLHFGYRIIDEIFLYISNNKLFSQNIKSSTKVFIDEQIAQKILPKLYGDKASLEYPVEELLKLLKLEFSDFESEAISIKMLERMKSDLESKGFASAIF